jgi:hypothetical protein
MAQACFGARSQGAGEAANGRWDETVNGTRLRRGRLYEINRTSVPSSL